MDFIIIHIFSLLVYVALFISKPSLIKLSLHGFCVIFTIYVAELFVNNGEYGGAVEKLHVFTQKKKNNL